MAFEKISVIGLGYIGLPTAAAFAARKKHVVGVDVNQNTVDIINGGEIHIVEPELDMVVHAVVKEGYLRATIKAEPADAFLIAVPTPFLPGEGEGDHKPDMSYVQAAANAVAQVLKIGDLVILESTSPVGATEQLAEWLASARPDLSFPQQKGEESNICVAYCPERVLPGHVMRELIENDRIIGGMTARCSQAATDLYKTFVQGKCVVTNARTAEMAKLTENSFRDVNIAFANELSIICDKQGINVWEMIKLANRHPRVNILNPGPGVGGHCIAVDPWFIVSSSPEDAHLIKTARQVNDNKPHYVVDKVIKAAAQFKEPVIACLGLAFKADIDDLRASPAVAIIEELAGKDIGNIIAVEPNVEELPQRLSDKGVEFASLDIALEKANVVVLLVDHQEFKVADRGKFEAKVVIDTRGILA